MNYRALRERPTQFLALTSLRPAEFDAFLPHFAPRWERHYRYHTLNDHRRRIPAHRGAVGPVFGQPRFSARPCSARP